jgi:paraquat-inducible protein B
VAKRSNAKIIGAFVVGAISLLVIAVLVFGGAKFLAQKQKFVLFFEGSLAGLDVGSPVTFRGIKIGSVTDIIIEYDIERQALRIPVYAEIELDRVEVISGTRTTHNLQALVERGLRAQLQVQSLVTGQVSVDADFYPDTPLKLVGTDKSIPEVPTVPSDIDVLKSNLTSVLNKISKLPLDQIASGIIDVLHTAERGLKDGQLTIKDSRELVDNINAQVKPLSESIIRLMNDVDAQVKPLSGSVIGTMDQAGRTFGDAQSVIKDVRGDLPKIVGGALQVLTKAAGALDQADSTLTSAQRIIEPNSPLYVQANQTLQEIKGMAVAIRVLAEYLQRNPNSVLTGKH